MTTEIHAKTLKRYCNKPVYKAVAIFHVEPFHSANDFRG